MQHDLTPAFVAECLSYDPATGEIRWRERPPEHFATKAAHSRYITQRVGEPAGCVDDSTGYLVIGLGGKIFYAHRLIWAIAHGDWPAQQIDHIDGNKLDNRMSNLRSVSQADNNRNTPTKRTNRSGVCGVGYAKREGKWRARIMRDYRDIHLGYFATKEQAAEARAAALTEYGFHANHGRAA